MTDRVLEEIGAGGKDKIMVYNKLDLVDGEFYGVTTCESVNISAETGENVEALLHVIAEHVFADREEITLLVPYDKGEVISYICDKGIVKSMEHREDGTLITAELLKADYSRVKKYGIV